MGRIGGLFLDLDGTLADSVPLLKAVFKDFMAAYGLRPDPAEFKELAGYRIPEIMALLKKRYGLAADPARMVDHYLAAVGSRYQKEAAPAPGARELLAAARERGVYVAVVTSSPAQVAQGFLEAHGLASYVSAVVGAESVTQGKPHPQPFLLALARAGIPAERGIAVEDSAAGARSALAAGLATYLISLSGPPPRVPGVAGRISRLDELVEVLA